MKILRKDVPINAGIWLGDRSRTSSTDLGIRKDRAPRQVGPGAQRSKRRIGILEGLGMKRVFALLIAMLTLGVGVSFDMARAEEPEVADEEVADEDLSRAEARQEGREGRQDARQEGREGRQDARFEDPEARQDARQDAREDRQDARQEAREGRRDARWGR